MGLAGTFSGPVSSQLMKLPVAVKSLLLSSINNHSEAGFLWRFSMKYM